MSIFDAALKYTPHSCARMLVRRDVVVANYHLIAPEAPPHITGVLPHKTPDQFEHDLLFLKRHYNVVSYKQILEARNGGTPLPTRAVAITFDDGFRECYEHVRPLLLNHGLPCTFFLITGSIDNRRLAYPNRAAVCLDTLRTCPEDMLKRAHHAVRNEHGIYCGDSREALYQAVRALTIQELHVLDTLEHALELDSKLYLRNRAPYLTTDQIREMMAEGFSFGAHTKTHPQLWLVDDERLESEIAESCEAVCALTGESAVPFAFPYRSNAMPRSKLAAIRERHPQVGLLFDTHGFMRDKPFVVPRLSFDDPAGATGTRSNLHAGLNRGYIAQAAKAVLGRGTMS